jgi:SAM-dependent methyltransferase
MDENFTYCGNELLLFAQAKNWKDYLVKSIKPYIKGDVLEVGAGLGATTKDFVKKIDNFTTWTCLEPDKNLFDNLVGITKSNKINYIHGSILNVNNNLKFDSIIYIDVLEHILEDQKEIIMASSHLKEKGFIVVLSPAHNYLFSEFDKQIGHYKRYNRKDFINLTLPSLKLIKNHYLDSVGVILSYANKTLLKQNIPTIKQINFWDTKVIPVSRILDKLFMYKIGKSILGVWKKIT